MWVLPGACHLALSLPMRSLKHNSAGISCQNLKAICSSVCFALVSDRMSFNLINGSWACVPKTCPGTNGSLCSMFLQGSNIWSDQLVLSSALAATDLPHPIAVTAFTWFCTAYKIASFISLRANRNCANFYSLVYDMLYKSACQLLYKASSACTTNEGNRLLPSVSASAFCIDLMHRVSASVVASKPAILSSHSFDSFWNVH